MYANNLVVVQAQDNIFEIGGDLVASTETLLKSAIVVIAIIFFIVVAAKTKFAFGPMLLAAVAAGFAVFLVNNVDLSKDIVEDTINNPDQVTSPDSGSGS